METALKQQNHLNPDCVKVVFYGPESTGKSYMANILSEEYSEPCVKEYSRWYAERMKRLQKPLTKNDVLPIAIGQMQLENQGLKSAKELLICDTELLQTKVYSEHYYQGYCPNELHHYALENNYHCYFLCYIDTTWKDDGIRDRPDDRLSMYKAFETALIASGKPYVSLKGTFEEKLNDCRTKIDELLKPKL